MIFKKLWKSWNNFKETVNGDEIARQRWKNFETNLRNAETKEGMKIYWKNVINYFLSSGKTQKHL